MTKSKEVLEPKKKKKREIQTTFDFAEPAGLELIEDERQREDLERLVHEGDELNEELKELQIKKAAVTVDIEIIMSSHQVKSIAFDGLTTSYFTVEKETLNKELLLRAGVTADVIKACSTKSKYTVVKITRGKVAG